jgi:hypothetical protein
VPEWGGCLVLEPRRPGLYELNLSAWLVLELCDGRSGDRILAGYRDAVGNRRDSIRADVTAALRNLLAAALIHIYDPNGRSCDHDDGDPACLRTV